LDNSRAVFYLYNLCSFRHYSLYDPGYEPFSGRSTTLFQNEIRRDHNLTFQDAQLKLLAFVQERIHNGELTERSFARMIGIATSCTSCAEEGAKTLTENLRSNVKVV